MHRSLALVVLVLGTAAAVSPAPAHAQRRDGARIVAGQQLVLLLNPMGAEHALDVGVRGSIGDQGDILFQGAHAQAGAITYVSPVYALGGGYIELSPLSFLVLRAEVTGGGIWPIGMNGAGYYGVLGYDADVRGQALAAEDGRSASGWSFTGSATLQGMLPLGPLRVLMASELALTRAQMGDAPFYYSMKYDLVLARDDLVLTSSSFVGVELDAASDLIVRVGAYDDLRHVPASGYVGHQVGPLVMLEWEAPAPGVASLAVFVRGGWYTHHVTRRDESTILGGVALSYDLGSVR
ncbi:MAG: hypothetical protein M3Y87_22695 [Myxococcota bacterium]|nr:hypothetical protein [Myxococcota bacterium]